MSVINTNVKSLVASNAINMNDSRLSQAMQRLSTGSRINAAKDDAAGLAIGTRMDAQIRGIKMGIENANTANSLLQTAEGAMDVVNSALQRMRELAVQASNGANTDQDRAALDIEVQQLKDQIDTIASKTTFNGINLLDGSFKNKLMLIGDKAADVMSLSVGSVNTASLGASAPLSKGVMVSGRVDAADFVALNKQILINGTAINAVTADSSAPSGSATADIADVVGAINSSNLGVTASAFNEVVAETKGSGVSAAGAIQITVTANDTQAATLITLGATTSLDDVVKQINEQGGEATVLARLNDQGKLVLYNNSGASISLRANSVAGASDSSNEGMEAMGFATDTVQQFNGFMKVASNNGDIFSVEIDGSTDPADYGKLGLSQVNAEGVVIGGTITSAITPAQWTPGSLKINGVDIWYSGVGNDITATGGTPETTANEIVKIINTFSAKTGVTAGLTLDSAGAPSLTLKSTDNSPIQIKLSESFKTGGAVGNVFGLVETNVAAADYDTNESSLAGYAGGRSVAAMDVLSQNNALSAIAVLDGALNTVSLHRANIGAYQNRLQSSINNLSNMVTNTEASRSRIMDADYATETTNLARAQIIQQAATAMLAQANQSAQTVLTLLK